MFHHVGQVGLKFLASSDLLASASQSVGITGISHHTWLSYSYWMVSSPVFIRDQGGGRVSLCHPGWSAVPRSLLTATSASWVQASLLPASVSWVAGTTSACHHTQLIFIFSVETGFHHVGQVGLKFLTSGDPPCLAFQSAGITGVSPLIQPKRFYLEVRYPGLNYWF